MNNRALRLHARSNNVNGLAFKTYDRESIIHPIQIWAKNSYPLWEKADERTEFKYACRAFHHYNQSISGYIKIRNSVTRIKLSEYDNWGYDAEEVFGEEDYYYERNRDRLLKELLINEKEGEKSWLLKILEQILQRKC